MKSVEECGLCNDVRERFVRQCQAHIMRAVPVPRPCLLPTLGMSHSSASED